MYVMCAFLLAPWWAATIFPILSGIMKRLLPRELQVKYSEVEVECFPRFAHASCISQVSEYKPHWEFLQRAAVSLHAVAAKSPGTLSGYNINKLFQHTDSDLTTSATVKDLTASISGDSSTNVLFRILRLTPALGNRTLHARALTSTPTN